MLMGTTSNCSTYFCSSQITTDIVSWSQISLMSLTAVFETVTLYTLEKNGSINPATNFFSNTPTFSIQNSFYVLTHALQYEEGLMSNKHAPRSSPRIWSTRGHSRKHAAQAAVTRMGDAKGVIYTHSVYMYLLMLSSMKKNLLEHACSHVVPSRLEITLPSTHARGPRPLAHKHRLESPCAGWGPGEISRSRLRHSICFGAHYHALARKLALTTSSSARVFDSPLEHMLARAQTHSACREGTP